MADDQSHLAEQPQVNLIVEQPIDSQSDPSRIVREPFQTSMPPKRPLVLRNVLPSMAIAKLDLFAPFTLMIETDGTEQAVQFDSMCPYSLASSVFGPPGQAMELAKRLRAGSITLNDLIVPTADPRMSFGGSRLSGFGATRGAEGLLEMTRVQSISRRTNHWLPHLDPPQNRDAQLLEGLLQWMYSASLKDQFRGLSQLIQAVRSPKSEGKKKQT